MQELGEELRVERAKVLYVPHQGFHPLKLPLHIIVPEEPGVLRHELLHVDQASGAIMGEAPPKSSVLS